MPYPFDNDEADLDTDYAPEYDPECDTGEGCEDDEACEDNESWRRGDLTFTLYRPVEGEPDPIFLTVVVVGGTAPWATCHCGRVVTGPPHPEHTLTCCGVQEGTLPWNDGNYWLLDAVDEDGNSVELSPSEHRDMLATAAVTPPGMQVF